MIRKDSAVPASRVNRKELILSTILKVYAIRAEVEERAGEGRLGRAPLLGGLARRLSSPSLAKSQYRDAAAFVTATCTSSEALVLMEQIAGFKAKVKTPRPSGVWLAYAGLALPLLVAFLAEAYMYSIGVLTTMPYVIVAVLLVAAAVVASIVLFAYLGYDEAYRRDTIEKAVWGAMHDEAVRRLKRSGVIKTHDKLSS